MKSDLPLPLLPIAIHCRQSRSERKRVDAEAMAHQRVANDIKGLRAPPTASMAGATPLLAGSLCYDLEAEHRAAARSGSARRWGGILRFVRRFLLSLRGGRDLGVSTARPSASRCSPR